MYMYAVSSGPNVPLVEITWLYEQVCIMFVYSQDVAFIKP